MKTIINFLVNSMKKIPFVFCFIAFVVNVKAQNINNSGIYKNNTTIELILKEENLIMQDKPIKNEETQVLQSYNKEQIAPIENTKVNYTDDKLIQETPLQPVGLFKYENPYELKETKELINNSVLTPYQKEEIELKENQEIKNK